MKRKLKARTKTGTIVFYSVLALVVVVLITIVFVLYANYRNVSKISQVSSLEASELYSASAKGKTDFYVFAYGSKTALDSDTETAVLDYATLIRKEGRDQYAFRLYTLDTDAYANNHIVYSGDGVSTALVGKQSFDDLVIKLDDLPVLIKMNDNHEITKVFIKSADIIEELKSTTALIKFA